jgi:hypothetical protein
MKCPKCQFEQTSSDTCTQCGIIFSKYKEIQERKKEEAKNQSRFPRNSALSEREGGNSVRLYIAGVLFISVLVARSLYFLQFPPSLDPYFRVLMLIVMIWLSYKITPKVAHWMYQLEERKQDESGQSWLKLYDKTTIVLFLGLGAVMSWFLLGAIFSGEVECFSGRNRTCHDIYDSVADTGEFWVTVLLHYSVTLFTITMGFMGLQWRRLRK